MNYKKKKIKKVSNNPKVYGEKTDIYNVNTREIPIQRYRKSLDKRKEKNYH